VPRPQKVWPSLSPKKILNFPKIFSIQSTPIDIAAQKFTGPQGPSKNLRVSRHEFWVGGPDPQRGGRSPQLVGALGRHPKGAHSCERTAAISAAVAEKIAFEIFFSTPPSGDPEHRSDPILRTSSHHLEAYIVWKFRDPTPPRSHAIRLFRNLKMPYYGNARHRNGFYTRARIRQK